MGLAEELVAELVRRGAQAVVLTGSHARGDATSASDLDLMVVGDGPDYLLVVQHGVLVAQSWASEAAHRGRMHSPPEIGTSVPGWREAVILHDPDGVAARLKDEALSWTWEEVGARCDRWVAEELTGFAEEVQKLSAALDRRHALTAAVQRDLLALRLILAVHHRLLYGSENVLWEQVGERMGAEWRSRQAAAFSIGGESLEESCAAAMSLFRLAAGSASALLDERQAGVVENVLSLAARDDESGA